MLRKSRASTNVASSAIAPASSTPVGPPPITTNVRCRRCSAGSLLALRRLERQQHAPPDLDRVVEILQPRRDLRPIVVPEVRILRARRDHQKLIVERRRLAREHASSPPDPRRVTSANSTRAFSCRRSTLRIGAAISAGASPAIAT